MIFHFFPWKRSWPFILKTWSMNPFYQSMLCAKFVWNGPVVLGRSRKCKKVYWETDRRTKNDNMLRLVSASFWQLYFLYLLLRWYVKDFKMRFDSIHFFLSAFKGKMFHFTSQWFFFFHLSKENGEGIPVSYNLKKRPNIYQYLLENFKFKQETRFTFTCVYLKARCKKLTLNSQLRIARRCMGWGLMCQFQRTALFNFIIKSDLWCNTFVFYRLSIKSCVHHSY